MLNSETFQFSLFDNDYCWLPKTKCCHFSSVSLFGNRFLASTNIKTLRGVKVHLYNSCLTFYCLIQKDLYGGITLTHYKINKQFDVKYNRLQ